MNGKSGRKPAGIGTGYLSIMMIFVVLCLTMLAALSYSTASGENRYSQKSAEYTKSYYAADLAAKRVLAEVDGVVSGYGDPADFLLLAELDGMENITYENVFGGIEVSWSTPINSTQSIFSRVKFTGEGFEIISWRTGSTAEQSGTTLNVWDGE
ncbi:MAG: hypothetical protein NC253_05895 [Ruminococcus sp.]|nr:hypothetical protein [Ruminococcus sp.]MCM1381261.1 hypothetical protein [Muribaculaceae bacterium]MCM1478612.1 hypothetical protein [Muribaculaceae bacterium]